MSSMVNLQHSLYLEDGLELALLSREDVRYGEFKKTAYTWRMGWSLSSSLGKMSSMVNLQYSL